MSRATERHPRVLVVAASALRAGSNTGTTLAGLFHAWPADRLAQLHLDDGAPDPNVCRQARRIDPHSNPWVRRARRIGLRRGDSRPSRPSGDPVLRFAAADPWWKRATRRLGFAARAWADMAPLPVPPAVWNWLDEFRPQVVYSVLGSIQVMRLAYVVSRRLGVPVVPHFLDDWPTTKYRIGPLAYAPRRLLDAYLDAVMQRAPLGLAISAPMAAEYRLRFGCPFDVFANSVDVRACADVAPARLAGSAAQAVYVGGLHLGRWELLREIGQSALELTARGLPVDVVVYAPAADLNAYGPRLTELGGVRLGGSLASHEVSAVLRGADVLLHVESFAPELRRFTRLSISTKLPQYMAAGRPILAYGPAELASCRYVEQCRSGLVIGQRAPDRLRSALQLLFQDPALRDRLGAAGWQAAQQRHDIDCERQRFREVLAEAARGPAAARPSAPWTEVAA